ncbi:ComEA family DNA-binding protein [Streptomyces sp. NBC_00154]|uniref:ComEA family DNA-binding protein n=1 Tax=Streptomyces sp. NBC_00154 TaxID=2975670 RepID=UPI00224D7542|nr:ComEA family DNA-binding protein [Streptomyces sp. NBC_00154]MCX5313205.1 ComEA family DNA-binding protein [Streptomyces sp. NBC_00154]
MAPRSDRAHRAHRASSGSGPGRAAASDVRARRGSGAGQGVGAGHGPGSGSGPRPGPAPGRRRLARGRAAGVAAASRHRADALMAGAYGGRVSRPVVGLAPPPVPQPTPAEENARAVPTAPIAPGRWERLVPAVRERLPMWLQLRCGLEPRTLAALAVVLVAAAVFAAVHFWSARPQSVRAPDPVSEGAQAPASDPRMEGGVERARTPDPSPGPPPTGGPGGGIVVDVSGKVSRPGIYPLPSGARVADALRAAGGVRSGVDLTGLNRARVLMDGEQVVVGAPPGPQAFGATGGAAVGGAATGAGGGPATGPVSLNSATVEQLDTLPGVGPVLAQHIVDYRTQHGGFRSVGELREVNGIGDRRFADLQPLVRP